MTHAAPFYDAIAAAVSRKAQEREKRCRPCRCDRLAFPHRRDRRCDEWEDEHPPRHDGGNMGCADEDELSADNRERARDCNLAAKGR